MLLVEDDPPTRIALSGAVEAHPELVLVGAAASCCEARELLSDHEPDVLLTDLELPDGTGIDLIRELRSAGRTTLPMVITVFADEERLVRAIQAGARGYLLKGQSPERVAEAILQLVSGGSPISAPVASYLLRRLQEIETSEDQEGGEGARLLSPREREVLELVGKGFTFAEIGRTIGVSSHTVATHVRRIYRKLDVSSRGEAVYEALQLGLIKLRG